jgi:hypothetical protein
LYGSRAYPYPQRWRHAYTAPHAAAIGLSLGAGQKVVGNLLGWQKDVVWSRHRDVREAHQLNAGGVLYEGAAQQWGTKGEGDSHVAAEGVDVGYVVRELKMATTVAAVLVGGQG